MSTDTSSQPSLDIRLFGSFRVCIDGVLLDERRWLLRSAKSLVKLLSMAPGLRLPRDQIVASLWPELAPNAASNALNKAVHAARRAFEPTLGRGPQSRFVLTDGSFISLVAPGEVQVDAQHFEQAVHKALSDRDPAAARDALRLYGGALFVDDLYEAWTFSHRDGLRRLFQSATMAAAQGLAKVGEASQGIELLQRLLLDEPADEAAHRLLVQLFIASAQPKRALAQIERACAALAADGLRPGAELLSLAAGMGSAGLAAGASDGPEPDLAPADLPPRPAAEHESASLAQGHVWTPDIVPITFSNGQIQTARASRDGRSVLLVAEWGNRDFGLYRLDLDSGEMAQLLPQEVALFAVSPQGVLALGLRPRRRHSLVALCQLRLTRPGEVLDEASAEAADGVQCADWHPRSALTGDEALMGDLAIVREVDGRNRLEFPIGTVRHLSAGWISDLRCSPDGRFIAFLEHPIDHDDEGDVRLLDIESGTLRVLTARFISIHGLAWRGDVLWFTASLMGPERVLYRVTLAGQMQWMHRGPGNLRMQDVAPSGQLLISSESSLVNMRSRHARDVAERDISWHAMSTPRDISADGQLLLVEESFSAGRQNYTAFLRHIDGSGMRKIADGVPLVLSPDAGRVLLRLATLPSRLAVHELRTGLTRALEADSDQTLVHNEFASFFPNGRRIAFSAADAQGAMRIYLQHLEDGPPVCFTVNQPGMRMPWNRALSPDGKSILMLDPDDRVVLQLLAGGPARRLPGLANDVRLLSWTEDGLGLFLHRLEHQPEQIMRYELATGTLTKWRVLEPDETGKARLARRIRITPDGHSLTYAFERRRSDLYLVDDGH